MHFDSHVHSAASPDSELNPVDAIKTLKHKNLGVIFTEHVDFETPKEGMDKTANDAPQGTQDFICDFDIYPSQYKHLRSNSVLLGIEIGLTAAYYPINCKIADAGFDFVLGSIHNVDGRDVFRSSNTMDAEIFCRRYLTYAKEMVEYCGFFDSFGHIDYIARYSDNTYNVFHYSLFPKEFNALLKAIAERDLAMEINTSRFGNDDIIGKLQPIYKRFHELGGKYVTIGSDAHNIQGLGRFYKKAIGLANMSNLTPVYFKERKRIICGKNN